MSIKPLYAEESSYFANNRREIHFHKGIFNTYLARSIFVGNWLFVFLWWLS